MSDSVTLYRNNEGEQSEIVTVDSDVNLFSKHSKKTECLPLSQLEDLITCPIHLGMMEDPRILICGHVFCLYCLQSCVTSFGSDFRCPVCRREAPVNEITLDSLPPSIQTKQLTDCIIEAKIKYYDKKYGHGMECLSSSNVSSLDIKRGLVVHLIKEISDYTREHVPNADFYTNQLEKVLKCMESSQYLTSKSHTSEKAIIYSSNNVANMVSSNYELMDVETIRENMKKYSEYKVLRDVNQLLARLYLPVKTKLAATNIKLSNDEPEIFAWTYTQSSVITVKSAQEDLTTFTLKIGTDVLKPKHIKVYNNSLYVSGITKSVDRQEKRYHFIQCSLSGHIIQRAVFNDEHGITTEIAGFHIEHKTGKVLVAMPTACKIAVLSPLLIETDLGYNFPDLHPRFVTQNPEWGEIWVSCPQNAQIVIVDEESGSYRQLVTDRIYHAIPSDIIVTSDNRVLFLDCNANKVFWVRKRNEFILIQMVSFIGHHNKHLRGKITSISAVSSPGSKGKFLYTTPNKVCLVRPAKIVGEHHPRHVPCCIL